MIYKKQSDSVFHCIHHLTLIGFPFSEEWEARQKAREGQQEDAIKRKHREADLEKQRKLEAFNKQAADRHESKHLDMAEQHLKDRVSVLSISPLTVFKSTMKS